MAEEVVSCQLGVGNDRVSGRSEIFHWRHLSFFISSRFNYAHIEMQTTTDASGPLATDNFH